jgi:hypothetical protein
LDTLREAPTLTGPLDDESTMKGGGGGPTTRSKSYAAAVAGKEKVVAAKGPTDFSHLLIPAKSADEPAFEEVKKTGAAKRKGPAKRKAAWK